MTKIRLIADCILAQGLSMMAASWMLALPFASHMADLAPGVEFAAVCLLIGGAGFAFVLACMGLAREGRIDV